MSFTLATLPNGGHKYKRQRETEAVANNTESATATDTFRNAARAGQYIETLDTPQGPVARNPKDEAAPGLHESDASETDASSTTDGNSRPSMPDEVTTLLAEPLVLSDLGLASRVQKPATATRGIRGVLGRIGIRMAPGLAEQEALAHAAALRQFEETIRQAVWTRAVSVLVANKKGGVGKTPTALGIGGILASVRGGSVAIVEVSDDPGALAFRAEGSPQIGLGELMRDVQTIRSAGQLAGYTAPQTSFASVIGTVGRRPHLTHDDVVAIAHLIDEYYGIRVMDSGNQPSSSAFQAALETADALVIPTYNSGDSILDAVDLLESLRAQGGHAAELAHSSILLRLHDGRPENNQVIERIDRIIVGANPGKVFHVPYDAHIAERGPITLASLAPATYWSLAEAAAGVVRSLQSNVR
jgi:MinD-like ATPase involved in chromosome partitioning or flagellar assembly